MHAAGADGCRGGWIGVSREGGGPVTVTFAAQVASLVASLSASQVLAIDVPIGLPDSGSRDCDVRARAQLRPRGSVVFPAPLRAVLAARSYEEACALRCAIEGKRMSLQAWGIAPKIREVDAFLREHPERRGWLREVHPELSFLHWNEGRGLPPKKKADGRDVRRRLVEAAFGKGVVCAARRDAAREAARLEAPPDAVATDDLLDAFAALWTAERILRGEACTAPGDPPLDRLGLRMEIVS